MDKDENETSQSPKNDNGASISENAAHVNRMGGTVTEYNSYSWLASHRSASSAAMQPLPAAVTAWR